MNNLLDCIPLARNVDIMCSRTFEIICHKCSDKDYEPVNSERTMLYQFLSFFEHYKTTQLNHPDNRLFSEIEAALSSVNTDKMRVVCAIERLLTGLINENLPNGCNLSLDDKRLAKSALFDISSRVNQLMEPESI